MRRWLTPLTIALALGVALAGARFAELEYMGKIDMRLMDFRLIQRGPIRPGPDVVIVAVDNASIAEIGRWPWPRSIVARLIDRITGAEPAVIAFDMVFSEPSAFQDRPDISAQPTSTDRASWEATQQVLAAQDEMLRDSLRRSDRAVLGYFFDLDADDKSGSAAMAPETYAMVRGTRDGSGESKVERASAIITNLPGYDSAARAMGFFNERADPDGYVRRLPMALAFGDDLDMAVPLELATLRIFDPTRPISIRFDPYGVEAIGWGTRQIPVDQTGRLLINYRGPGMTFPHVAAADILAGRADPAKLRDRIVILGVTAVAVGDVRVTPFDKDFPGVEIHASVVDNILRGDFIYGPTWLVLVDCGVVVGLSLMLGLAMRRLRGVGAGVLAILLIATYLLVSQRVFVFYGLPLSLAYPMLTIVLVYSAVAVEQYVTQDREKRKVRRALELYLSPSMASVVAEHPEELKLGGEKRELTVLFSDIRGFTRISEGLSPEALVELLNEYLGAMTDIVFRHDGMLDKYIGDAVMAIWGAPLPQPDHAARACLATLDMVDRLAELNAEWERRGWQRLKIGIGVNTGPMAFGNMGSAQHLSLTVMGDNVNLASRVEGLNKDYGTAILVTESAYTAAGDSVFGREIDFVRVRGKQEVVRIYQLLCRGAERERYEAMADEFAGGLAAYRARKWDQASQLFRDIVGRRPEDTVAQVFAQRCDRLAHVEVPETWDGVMLD